MFASNIKQTSSCIFEAITLNIPCSTLLDSNIGHYGIFYGIPSNDDNFVTIYLFTRLFVKIYLKSIYDNIKNLKLSIKQNKIKKINENEKELLNLDDENLDINKDNFDLFSNEDNLDLDITEDNLNLEENNLKI